MTPKKPDSDQPFTVSMDPVSGKLHHEGKQVAPPDTWAFLPSGDATLTRRVKNAGPHWIVQKSYRGHPSAIGLWAPATIIATQRQALEQERVTPAYQQRLAASRRQRDHKQERYTGDFRAAVLAFLRFAPRWAELAQRLADAVTEHAVPVGSGTVARTERIPIDQRAEAAVIAWMRHQTTAYDRMSIARAKGERRQVRYELAQRSRMLLDGYRRGVDVNPAACTLVRALAKPGQLG